jgi:hypothetical protein
VDAPAPRDIEPGKPAAAGNGGQMIAELVAADRDMEESFVRIEGRPVGRPRRRETRRSI